RVQLGGELRPGDARGGQRNRELLAETVRVGCERAHLAEVALERRLLARARAALHPEHEQDDDEEAGEPGRRGDLRSLRPPRRARWALAPGPLRGGRRLAGLQDVEEVELDI